MSENLSYPIGKFQKPEIIDTKQIAAWIDRIESLPERISIEVKDLNAEELDTPYRPGGWTIRQVIHHVPDSYINSYIRFHWTLTEDNPKIKAYNEAAWAELGYLKALDIQTSLDLLRIVHKRWVALLRSLKEADLDRTFVHPEDNNQYALREVIGMYAWHGEHHLAHITNLKNRMNW